MTAEHAHEPEPADARGATSDSETLNDDQKRLFQGITNALDPSRRGVPYALWERIEAERTARKWSWAEFSERAGLPRASIANLKTSARVPFPHIIQAVAAALDIDIDEASVLAGVQPLPDEPEDAGLRIGQAVRDAEGGKLTYLGRRDHRPIALVPADMVFIPEDLVRDGNETVQLVLTHMQPQDVVTFLWEAIEAGRITVAAGDSTPLAVLFAAWRHTAEVFADPELLAALTGPTDGDYGPVPEPPAV